MSDEELLKNKGIIEEFNTIGNILKLELNYNIKNDLLGDIVYPSGSIGDLEKEKGGFGIKHIIQGRYEKDNLNIDEICVLLYKIKNIAETVSNKDIQYIGEKKIILLRDNIQIVLSNGWFEEKNKWIITGYEKKGLTENIKEVVSYYTYALEHSDYREQVGAVISYIKSIRKKIKDNNKNTLNINNQQITNIKNKEEKGRNDMGEYTNEFFEKFKNLPEYNYDKAVMDDICDFLDEEIENFKSGIYSDFVCKMSEYYDSEKDDDEQFELKEAIIEYVEENVYREDDINGSYWCNMYEAQCCLFRNECEVEKAIEYFGYENINRPNDAETLDLLVRMSKTNEKISHLMDKDYMELSDRNDYLKLTIDAVKKYLSLEQDKGCEK